jgi:hypothetical protein
MTNAAPTIGWSVDATPAREKSAPVALTSATGKVIIKADVAIFVALENA